MRRPYGRERILEDDYEVVDLSYGDCWIWRWAKANGYGRVWHEGRLRQAHTVMWEQSGRIIPEGTELDHLCGSRACIRPDHLEPVKHAENVLRGPRGKWPREVVEKIRSMSGSHYTIADELGMPPSTVYFIRSGRQRKDC